jgi:adenosylhomocysteine nucleosidase
MRRWTIATLLASVASVALAACDMHRAVDSASGSASAQARPLVVQGAMDLEIGKLVGALNGARQETIGGWTFWSGMLDGYPVVISKTRRGMSNAAAATVLAAQHYRPAAIINQGTAGGHQPDLHVFDIVIGMESVNLAAFRTPYRAPGAGSVFADWSPIDLLRSEGSVSQDPRALTMHRFHADKGLLASARGVRDRYRPGRVVEGVIGSSDTWNSEIDRIRRFHEAFGTAVEEMETASAAQIAEAFQIPFIGVRVVSNNITNGEKYEPRTGEACQDYVSDVVKRYVAARLSSVSSR